MTNEISLYSSYSTHHHNETHNTQELQHHFSIKIGKYNEQYLYQNHHTSDPSIDVFSLLLYRSITSGIPTACPILQINTTTTNTAYNTIQSPLQF